MSVPNTKVFVDIPAFRLHADPIFKLNGESSLLINGILVVVIAFWKLTNLFLLCLHSSGEVASWV